MQQRSKNFFWASLTLTLSLGLVFLFTALPQAQAIDVDVTSEVAGGGDCVPDGTTHDCGPLDVSECPDGVTHQSCLNSCNEAIDVIGICGGGTGCQPNGSCVNIAWSQICIPDVGDTSIGTEQGTGNDNCGNACNRFRGCVPGAKKCKNGVVEPPEQCDDISPCCNSSCEVALQIQILPIIVPNQTTRTVNWTVSNHQGISCSPVIDFTTSDIEWGTGGSYNDGIGNLNSNNGTYSFDITGLTLNVADYGLRITATYEGLQDIEIRTFNTLGPEICNNGIDDDNDGFIDIADNDCPCTAEWDCVPPELDDAECINNQQIRVCTQTDTCWDTSNPPFESQGCGECAGPPCPAGQEIIDPLTCECGIIPDDCGNTLCEPEFGEDPLTCPQDCQVDCISIWSCDPWEPEICPESGIQTQSCTDDRSCVIPTNPPDALRTCGVLCPGLVCGVGEQANRDICICEAEVPFCGNSVCEAGENFLECPADCIEECIPNWLPSVWGPCINGTQQRTVTDIHVPSCNLDLDKPPTIRSCDGSCEPAIACGLGQTIDLVNCRCNDIIPFCGNRVCEENEFTWSCPVDCGLPPGFGLELTACLDGLDNDNDGFVDYPADPGCSSPSDNSELNLAEILENIQKFLNDAIFDNKVVEAVNELAAPVVIVAIAVNTFASFSFLNLLSYARYFFSQPFAVLFRRKRRKWGVVYNALTKQAIDLAIVRLYDNQTKRIVQSRVTDRQGRYSFLAQPGRYYITVTKPKFDFPTNYLKDEKEDVKYLDIYHGEIIEVTANDAAITVNIPIDSQVEEKPVRKVIFQYYLRKVQYVAAFSAIPLSVLSAAITPGPLTFSLLGFHILLFVLFRRLGYQKKPKSWGIVYDKTNKKPIGRAIARIYDKKYNKLLDTRVTDAKGRYSFLVNNNIYVVTAEKLGYNPFKTEDINLVKKDADTIVGMDMGLNKAKPGEEVTSLTPTPSAGAPAAKPGLPTKQPPTTLPDPKSLAPEDVTKSLDKAKQSPASTPDDKPSITEDPIEEKIDELSVARGSLEDLVKQKEEVAEVKEEIDEKQAELEKLEDKVEEIEKEVDQKIIDEKSVEKPTEKNAEPEVKEKPEEETKKDEPPQPPEKSIFG